ncbi:hypothetical protein [Nocardia asiatica]|uniref:hypothetical protein n=1 Tax=Nocardia asiatica TaxID=209252 RepID=UPI002456C32D|nr:hypothetical protein [Nocardia asiatica]
MDSASAWLVVDLRAGAPGIAGRDCPQPTVRPSSGFAGRGTDVSESCRSLEREYRTTIASRQLVSLTRSASQDHPREMAVAQHQRQPDAARWQQISQFLDALAPEIISACGDLGFRMSRAQRRFGSLNCWDFYLEHPKSDGYVSMHVGFVPTGGWLLLGKRMLDAYGGPHDDRFWIVPKDPGLLDGGTIKHGRVLAPVELSLGLDQIRAQLIEQLRQAARR